MLVPRTKKQIKHTLVRPRKEMEITICPGPTRRGDEITPVFIVAWTQKQIEQTLSVPLQVSVHITL